MREYFDYHNTNEETVIMVGGTPHLIVKVDSLPEIENYSDEVYRSTIDYGNWEDKGYSYRPKRINCVTQTPDGKYIVVFEMEMID